MPEDGGGRGCALAGFVTLPGGTAHEGRIRRRGDEVLRPRLPGATARHALLAHLERVGFAGAPRVHHLGPHDELLSYLPGTVAGPPLAEWATTDEALASVGALLRALHDATTTFDAAAWSWPGRVPPRHRTGEFVVAHNDPHPGNVVFRDGVAVGLIDFDLAEPASRAWDLASAACFWVPLLDPVDVADARAGRASARLDLLREAYGSDATLRAQVREAVLDAHDWIYAVIRDGARAGHPGFLRSWQERREAAARGRSWIRRTVAA